LSLWDDLDGKKIIYPESERQNTTQDCERPIIKPYTPKKNSYTAGKHKSNIEKLREALWEGEKCKN